ncbi:hypothetical protein CC2G_012440 [Coprinopsis cinerea AmutBmut pab1-1]|nr:hypothetical protein CC2G_012440 [Coprinopsis cinerea AmutBmut pab1-1]
MAPKQQQQQRRHQPARQSAIEAKRRLADLVLRDLVREQAKEIIIATLKKDRSKKDDLQRLLDGVDDSLDNYLASEKANVEGLLDDASKAIVNKVCPQVVERVVNPEQVKMPFSDANKNTLKDLDVETLSLGPLTGEHIDAFQGLVDNSPGTRGTPIGDLVDAVFPEGGENVNYIKSIWENVGMESEAGSRMLIDPILVHAGRLCDDLTGRPLALLLELHIAESEIATGDRGGPVDITAPSGKVHTFTGRVDYAATFTSTHNGAVNDAEGSQNGVLHVKNLVGLCDSLKQRLQLSIVEAKRKMTLSQLLNHLPQVIVQAAVTMKVVGVEALACILTNGFDWIFAFVTVSGDSTGNKYKCYHFDSYDWRNKDKPDFNRAKQLVAMAVCWGTLEAETKLRRAVEHLFQDIQTEREG